MGGRREGGEKGGKRGGENKGGGRKGGKREGEAKEEVREKRKEGGSEGRRKDGRSGKGGVGRRGERGGKGKTVVESIINHNILKIGPLNISSQNTYTCTCSMCCYVKKELDNSIMKEVGVTMKEIITCYYRIIPNNSYTLLIRALPLFRQKMLIFVI